MALSSGVMSFRTDSVSDDLQNFLTTVCDGRLKSILVENERQSIGNDALIVRDKNFQFDRQVRDPKSKVLITRMRCCFAMTREEQIKLHRRELRRIQEGLLAKASKIPPLDEGLEKKGHC